MKRIFIGLSSLMLLLSLAACSSGPEGARGAAVSPADDTLKKVVQCLEDSEYRKAEDLIQEKIAGNLTKEEAASAYLQAYGEGVVQDYNYGNLTFDQAVQILQTGQQTTYSSIFFSAESSLQRLQRSKEYYEFGKRAFEQGDDQEAVSALSMVDTEDSEFDSSVDMIYEIAQRNSQSEDCGQLRTSYNAMKRVRWAQEFPKGRYSPDELLTQLLEIGTRFGQALEADCQLRYAIQVFGQNMTLALAGQRSDMSQYAEDYGRVMRQVNYMEYDFPAGTYTLNQDGGVQVSDDAWWDIKSSGLTQVEVSSHSNRYVADTILGKIDRFGQVSLQGGQEDIAVWQDIQSTLVTQNGVAAATKLYLSMLDYDQICGALLYSNGTLAVGGDRSRYDLSELTSWRDVIDFYQIGKGFVGLMDNGQLCCTSSLGSKLGEAMNWSDIKALAFGQVQSQGYQHTMIGPQTNDFIYGLTYDGQIRYQQYNVSDGKVPMSGVADVGPGVRMIAGNGYLDAERRVHSLDPLVDESLEGYQDFEFRYLLSPNNEYPISTAHMLLLGWEDYNYELVTRPLRDFYVS